MTTPAQIEILSEILVETQASRSEATERDERLTDKLQTLADKVDNIERDVIQFRAARDATPPLGDAVHDLELWRAEAAPLVAKIDGHDTIIKRWQGRIAVIAAVVAIVVSLATGWVATAIKPAVPPAVTTPTSP